MSPEMEPIVFNRAHVTGHEFECMQEAIENAHLASSGPFSKRCAEWLVERTGCRQAFLTHSCTAALEMAFTLADIGPGDEVIMPSFTFVTTANAVVGRGGRPVFVDVREDTLCLDERLIESAITPRTKAVVPVHYAGVACEMGAIGELAEKNDLLVIEDAAQGIGATASGVPLGGIGHLGALSFHETKNVSCGEGGALLVNDDRFRERAEVVHEKGTDRSRFYRGQVDKYTWVDVGSSYALSELAAAYLWAQLRHEREITAAPARDLEPLSLGIRRARARGTPPTPGDPGARRAQRPHVLRAPRRSRDPYRLHRGARFARRERGVPLHPAAQLVRRPAARSRARRAHGHDRRERPPGATAAVGRHDRSSRSAG